MLEKPDAIGEKCDIESNDKATVGDDTSRTEGAGNDWIAEEGSVIKDETELRFVAKVAFQPEFVEDDLR